jgi:hypothetical protein
MGDEGKAVGCVPPTALLFRAIYIAANVASQPELLVALIKVTKKHEHITVGETG